MKTPPVKCQLEFKLSFEEIWDFNVKFMDWSTSDLTLAQPKNSKFNPYMDVKFDPQYKDNIVENAVISTKVIKNRSTAYWAGIGSKAGGTGDKLVFRGTMSQFNGAML